MKASVITNHVLAGTLAIAAFALSVGTKAHGQEQPPSSDAMAASVRPAAGTTGVNTKTYSVIVNVNGTLALGPAGSGSTNLFGLAGIYEVDFPSDVSHCVYTATIGDALADVPAPGIIAVTQRFGNPNGIYVQTFNLNGTRANHPFHLQAQC